MKTQAHRWIVVAAIISMGAGAALSHMIEPGVRVEKIMLTTNTPALRIFPTTPGSHPKVVLAAMETAPQRKCALFVSSGVEAFAAAGFDCYCVDQAGYGESPQSCSLTNLWTKFPGSRTRNLEGWMSLSAIPDGWQAQALRSVRVNSAFGQKLFIVGWVQTSRWGSHGPPLLLLFGRFDEFRLLYGVSLKVRERMRRWSFLPGASISPKPTIQCS